MLLLQSNYRLLYWLESNGNVAIHITEIWHDKSNILLFHKDMLLLNHWRALWRRGHLKALWRRGHLRAPWRCGHLRALWRYGHLRALWRRGHLRALWRSGHLRALWRSGHLRALWRSGHLRALWRSGHLRVLCRSGHLRALPRSWHWRVLWRGRHSMRLLRGGTGTCSGLDWAAAGRLGSVADGGVLGWAADSGIDFPADHRAWMSHERWPWLNRRWRSWVSLEWRRPWFRHRQQLWAEEDEVASEEKTGETKTHKKRGGGEQGEGVLSRCTMHGTRRCGYHHQLYSLQRLQKARDISGT